MIRLASMDLYYFMSIKAFSVMN